MEIVDKWLIKADNEKKTVYQSFRAINSKFLIKNGMIEIFYISIYPE